MAEIFLREESYKLIGICMEIHKELGMGFKEVIYKDALEIELRNNNIPYVRESNLKLYIRVSFFRIDLMLISLCLIQSSLK